MLYPLDKVLVYMYNICMKRIDLYLTKQQLTVLRELSRKTGLCVAELIRRAIDYWLEQTEENRSVKHEKGE